MLAQVPVVLGREARFDVVGRGTRGETFAAQATFDAVPAAGATSFARGVRLRATGSARGERSTRSPFA